MFVVCPSWTGSKSPRRLGPCVTCCGPTHWKTLATRRPRSILATTQSEDAPIFIGMERIIRLYSVAMKNTSNMSSEGDFRWKSLKNLIIKKAKVIIKMQKYHIFCKKQHDLCHESEICVDGCEMWCWDASLSLHHIPDLSFSCKFVQKVLDTQTHTICKLTQNILSHTHISVSAWKDIPQSPGRLHGSVAMTTGYSCQIWSDIKIQWENEGELHRRGVPTVVVARRKMEDGEGGGVDAGAAAEGQMASRGGMKWVRRCDGNRDASCLGDSINQLHCTNQPTTPPHRAGSHCCPLLLPMKPYT